MYMGNMTTKCERVRINTEISQFALTSPIKTNENMDVPINT